MKFVSIFTIDPATAVPPSEEMMTRMGAFIDELLASGKLIDTGGREPTGIALQVARSGGKVSVTDGPFTESKEMVGGFALFDVDSKEEVAALAERFLEIVGNGTCRLFEVSETPRSDGA